MSPNARNYATLNDRNYLPKMLSLHASLMRHSSEPFKLFILCMDDDTHKLLYEMQLPNVSLMTLPGFERELQLQKVRQSRTWTEYCWTVASSLLDYLLSRDLDEVAYLDADTYFFSDPKQVFDEIGSKGIGITPHRFPAEKKYMEKNGVYNVGWVSAKSTDAGRECIRRWAQLCRQWCFRRQEADRFGDQKYLDFWERDYPGEVCAIENIGVNLAPWNVSRWPITEGPQVDGIPVVFYHYHEYVSETQLTNYKLREEDKAFIYQPYNLAIRSAELAIAVAQVAIGERQKAMQELPVG